MPIQPQQQQRLLTPDEVASYLRLTRTQVIRQARLGRIPALKIGKAIRFQMPAIEKWAAGQVAI
jgi:excisionase family DNA binding protein